MRRRHQTRLTPSAVSRRGSHPAGISVLFQSLNSHCCLSSHLSFGPVEAIPSNTVEVNRAPMMRDLMSMFFMAPTLPTHRLIEEGFLRGS